MLAWETLGLLAWMAKAQGESLSMPHEEGHGHERGGGGGVGEGLFLPGTGMSAYHLASRSLKTGHSKQCQTLGLF